MKKGLYKMSIEYGRHGSVEALFVAPIDYVKKLIEIDLEINYGEILGKHSEVIFALNEEKDLELITDDEKVIDIFETHNISSGYNPFDQCIWNEELEKEITVEEYIESLLKIN